MKKILLIFFIFLPFFCTSSASKIEIIENPNIKLVINSKKITLESPTIISNSHMLFPLRELFNQLNISNEKMDWDAINKIITIPYNEKKLKMTINSNIAKINNLEVLLPCSPIIYNNQTYIPIRMLSEFLDCFIIWDDNSKTVFIKEINDYLTTKEFFQSVNNVASNIYDMKIDIINEIADTSFGSSIYINLNKNIVLEKNILSKTWQESTIKLGKIPTLTEINYISTLACGMTKDTSLSSNDYYVYSGFYPAKSGELTKAKIFIDTSTLYLTKLISETPTEIGILKQNVLFNSGTDLT